jgi:hypothetical protein
MFTRNIGRASRLALVFGGLVITATASAADVQSQAREVLTGRRLTSVEVSEATPAMNGSTRRPGIDAQQQAAHLFGGPSQEIRKAPSTRVTFRTPISPQPPDSRRFSSSQEMAQKLVLGTPGE